MAPAPQPISGAAAPFGGEWTLSEINSKAVRPVDKMHRKIVLSFDVDRQIFSGMSGCNELEGRFTALDGTLSLRPSKPMQICRADQKTERALRGVFSETRSFRMSGLTLELLDGNGKPIARLER